MMKYAIALVATGLTLSSCTTTQETRYNSMATALAGSKGLRNDFVKKCAADKGSISPVSRQQMALLMNVKYSQVDLLFCRRLADAVASGRLTYSDTRKVRQGQMTPKVIKILQGR